MIIVFSNDKLVFKGKTKDFLKYPECDKDMAKFLKQHHGDGEIANLNYFNGHWEIYKVGSDD